MSGLQLSINKHGSVNARENSRWINSRAVSRTECNDVNLMFVNVDGGSEKDMLKLAEKMRKDGFAAGCVAGPLVRASQQQKVTDMPLSTQQLGKHEKKAMEFAFEYHSARGLLPSDLKPGQKPKWGTHSARRGGAARALATMHLSGVARMQIDFHFGWDMMTHARENPMQWMYAGIQAREDRARVTRFF